MLNGENISDEEIDKIEPDVAAAKLRKILRDHGIEYEPHSQPKGLLPVLGSIRAGLPILADENIEDYLEVPEYLRADYVLRVQGDSMIGAGILDGDLVICRKKECAQSGQIVVALRDVSTGFSEATLKYYYEVNGDGPVLRPANPQYQEIPMGEGYRIAGIMVAMIREETPGYQVYQNYLAVNDSDEWAEVIDEATAAGIKPSRMKSFIKMLQEMK